MLCGLGETKISSSFYIAYSVILGLSGALLYLLLSRNIEKYLAALLSLAVFNSVIFESQITFLTGSHTLVGLSFALVAAILLPPFQRNLRPELSFFAASLFMFFAGLASSNFKLISLSLIPYMFDASYSWKRLLILTLITIAPVTYFLGSEIIGSGYHYSNLDGWVDYSVRSMARELSDGMSLLAQEYGVWFIVFICCITLLAAILSVASIQMLLPRKNKKNSSFLIEQNSAKLFLLFSASAFLTLLPSLITTQTQLRYLVPPLFYTVALFALLAGLLAGKLFRHRVIITTVTLSAIIIILSSQTYAVYNKKYLEVVTNQSVLSNAIRDASHQFPIGSQLLVYSEQSPRITTRGYNHWSTHLARLSTGRQDLTAVIGNADRMTEYPFLGEYKDHDPKYWKSTSAGQKRKQMVGLDARNPTFVYEFDGFELEQKHCIEIKQGERTQLYKAGQMGIHRVSSESVIDRECATFKLPIESSL